jgi:hypothetical protein
MLESSVAFLVLVLVEDEEAAARLLLLTGRDLMGRGTTKA